MYHRPSSQHPATAAAADHPPQAVADGPAEDAVEEEGHRPGGMMERFLQSAGRGRPVEKSDDEEEEEREGRVGDQQEEDDLFGFDGSQSLAFGADSRGRM